MIAQLLLVCLGLVVPSLGARVNYIVNGNEVTSETKWPHQCSLQYSSGSHTCGTSLISTTWLLTAAHCVGGSGYRVRCGTLYYPSGGQLRSVTRIIKHEDYNQGPGAYPNDIAVMQVSQAFTTSSTIQPINMWTGGIPSNSNNCHITGWGRTSGSSGIPLYLREAKINVYTESECIRRWGSNINSGHVCVGDTNNQRGACNGDSGGPLVCDGSLVGVTSWVASGCSAAYYPSVYTEVAHFRTWIRNNAGV